jgi:HEAT repeat protein
LKRALAFVVFAAVAHADPPPLSQSAIDTLSPIESLPTADDLTSEFGSGSGSSAVDNAVAALSAIATDKTLDVGLQIHAIRGLGEYPGIDAAHQTLTSPLLLPPALDPNGVPQWVATGTQVVIMRAAIEALGNLAKQGHETPGDAALLAQFLNHPSRDVRATTASALADLCDTDAILPLRTRFAQEPIGGQVQLAISEALRVLGTCTL